MAYHDLIARFNTSITWNGISYGISKCAGTCTTFFLYYTLSVNDFVTLASLQNILYLCLLWLDGGLRKSIPSYGTVLFTSRNHPYYVALFLGCYATLLALIATLFVVTGPSLAAFVHVTYERSISICAALLFCTEGLVSLLRLVYHAQFRNKQFNMLWTSCILCESVIILSVLSLGYTLSVAHILLIKTALSIAVCCLSLPALFQQFLWQPLSQTREQPKEQPAPSFIKHSLFMWLSTLLKSLSERNVVTPLIAHFFDPAAAATYKVSQDGALLIHRIVVRTIGVSDTALLAHSYADPQFMILVPRSFSELSIKIARLCIPLLALISAVAFPVFIHIFIHTTQPAHYTSAIIFFVLVSSYLLETLLSPYERLLEISTQYRVLFISYIPYSIGLVLTLFLAYKTYIHVVSCILILQAARLISSLLTLFSVECSRYVTTPACHFPWQALKPYTILSIAIASTICCSLLTLERYSTVTDSTIIASLVTRSQTQSLISV